MLKVILTTARMQTLHRPAAASTCSVFLLYASLSLTNNICKDNYPVNLF